MNTLEYFMGQCLPVFLQDTLDSPASSGLSPKALGKLVGAKALHAALSAYLVLLENEQVVEAETNVG